MEIYTLMYDREPVALTEKREGDTLIKYYLLPDPFKVPLGLFKDGISESYAGVMDFLAGRIIQPNRLDLKERLVDLGMTEFNAWQIIIKTGASTMNDGFWLKTHENATFENTSVRA